MLAYLMELESHFGLITTGGLLIQISDNNNNKKLWFYDMPLFEHICITVETDVANTYQEMSNAYLMGLIACVSV